jgi:hypothetical protein
MTLWISSYESSASNLGATLLQRVLSYKKPGAEKLSVGPKISGMCTIIGYVIAAHPNILKRFKSSPNTVNAISCVLRFGKVDFA